MSAITLTQYRNALFTLLTDQQAATPTLLRKVYRWRPGSIGEAPAAWIGDLSDDLGYDAGTRARVITGDVFIADNFPSDLVSSNDPFDNLRDALIERCTANAGVIPVTVFELTGVTEGDLNLQGAERVSIYRGMTLSTRLRIWEGRD